MFEDCRRMCGPAATETGGRRRRCPQMAITRAAAILVDRGRLRVASNESSDRLDSWKAIAAYLRRTERTARRWEQTERLPVHRLQHQERSSVYAFKSELDAWLAARGARATAVNDERQSNKRRSALFAI